jgi:hypothetical protein
MHFYMKQVTLDGTIIYLNIILSVLGMGVKFGLSP